MRAQRAFKIAVFWSVRNEEMGALGDQGGGPTRDPVGGAKARGWVHREMGKGGVEGDDICVLRACRIEEGDGPQEENMNLGVVPFHQGLGGSSRHPFNKGEFRGRERKSGAPEARDGAVKVVDSPDPVPMEGVKGEGEGKAVPPQRDGRVPEGKEH